MPLYNLDILRTEEEELRKSGADFIQDVDILVNEAGLPDGDQEEDATDDVHGGSLPADLVRAARAEEIQYVHDRRRY